MEVGWLSAPEPPAPMPGFLPGTLLPLRSLAPCLSTFGVSPPFPPVTVLLPRRAPAFVSSPASPDVSLFWNLPLAPATTSWGRPSSLPAPPSLAQHRLETLPEPGLASGFGVLPGAPVLGGRCLTPACRAGLAVGAGQPLTSAPGWVSVCAAFGKDVC